MNEGQIFHVQEGHDGKTVVAALRDWLPARSWSQIRKLVASRRVQLNGNLCQDEGRRLTRDDVVRVLAQAAPKPPSEGDLRIHYLDQHVCVVEKPAGVTSTRHADERNWPARRRQLRPTLEEMLPGVVAKLDPRMKSRRGVPPPLRPVHRLDRETSGLLVFARTVVAERGLMEQFKRHTTSRRYVGVAQGRVEATTFESQLVRDRGDGRRGSLPIGGGGQTELRRGSGAGRAGGVGRSAEAGKRAITHVRPMEVLGSEAAGFYTVVECRLETGRTHQIRIHLGEAGHPLCGERIYRQPMFKKPIPDNSGSPRVALHAAELGFVHPISGEAMLFEAPLPQDLQALIGRLRGGRK